MDEIEIADRLRGVEERGKSNTKRIDALEEGNRVLNSLASSIAVIAEKQTHMDADIKTMAQDMREIKSIPAKKWDSVSEKVVVAIIGGLVGYFLQMIFTV